ncbi:MAG: RNA-binding S4 domain-containing protein [Rubripirellula sp.]
MNVPSESGSQSRPISVRLDDFLKLQGLVGTGGEAKVRIQAGEVKVNDMVETRRRKQLSEGDRIEFDGKDYLVELNDL